jgi:peroxiredoxin Q/BCP
MIVPGGPAPDFTLDDQDGKPVTLSDLHGRWALVYFCPKAETGVLLLMRTPSPKSQ